MVAMLEAKLYNILYFKCAVYILRYVQCTKLAIVRIIVVIVRKTILCQKNIRMVVFTCRQNPTQSKLGLYRGYAVM